MPTFLTGATGFIGSRLAETLLEQGEQVHALVRSPKKAQKLEAKGVRLFVGDLEDEQQMARAMEGCRRAYHLAAYAQAWAPDELKFDRINYEGGLRVMEKALQAGIEKLVLTSTGGVIGASQGRPADESQSGHPRHMTAYERSKAKLEKAVPEFLERGLPVVIVNPARVFGPGALGDSNGEVRVMQAYLKGSFRFLPGDGRSKGSYCFVEDVVQGHLGAMQHGRPGERYILGGDNASYREFFDTIGELAGKKRRMFPMPIPLIMLFARLQIWMANNFGRYPLITPELVRKYAQDWSFSSEKAKQELGYEPRSLEESIRLTLEWLEQEKLLQNQ